MAKELRDFSEKHYNIGLVSSDTPLISNLNVRENMAIVKQYQQNFSKKDAEKLALQYLKRLNLETIANIRNPDLKDEERFCGMLLRASMVNDAVIIIDKPFKLLPEMKDFTFIRKLLKNKKDYIGSLYY